MEHAYLERITPMCVTVLMGWDYVSVILWRLAGPLFVSLYDIWKSMECLWNVIDRRKILGEEPVPVPLWALTRPPTAWFTTLPSKGCRIINRINIGDMSLACTNVNQSKKAYAFAGLVKLQKIMWVVCRWQKILKTVFHHSYVLWKLTKANDFPMHILLLFYFSYLIRSLRMICSVFWNTKARS